MKAIDTSGVLQMRAAILQQNAALQRAAAKPAVSPVEVGPTAPAAPNFSTALREALTSVNAAQATASDASAAYERGETSDIASVMLAREQAGLGFQATLQVRNKLLSAYRDIMSMPV